MKLRKDAKVERLSRVPLFANCSKRELALVAGIADDIEVPAGKTLVRQGKLGSEFFVLVDGTAEVRKGSRKVAAIGPGDFFGEIALISNQPRNATVTMTSTARALVVTTRD